MSGLVVQGVGVTRGARAVLGGIDATFARGQVTVILGPNGAGKSTLLSVLAGLRRPDAGAATLDGVAITSLAPATRAARIGYLPQSAELHWDLAVEEVVALGRVARQARFGALGEDDYAAIDQALDATDTRGFVGRRTSALSGGERARVLIARVLAGAPDWILADEPLANLDPAHQVRVLHTLAAVARGGAGVVLVLHDLTLAHWIADRVLLLTDGRVAGHGAPALLEGDVVERVYGVRVARVARDGEPPLIVPVPRAAPIR